MARAEHTRAVRISEFGRAACQAVIVLLIALAGAVAAFGVFAADRLADDTIKERIVAESVADYRARLGKPCPCPYSVKRNGQRCGDWSAYVKPGGEEPLCYKRDVTQAMVDAYRRRHDIAQP